MAAVEGDETVTGEEPEAELEGEDTVAETVSVEQPAESDQSEDIEPELADAGETLADAGETASDETSE